MVFSPRKPRYWFAWRPVYTECGRVAWFEVVEVHRGFGVSVGHWKKYTLANKPTEAA